MYPLSEPPFPDPLIPREPRPRCHTGPAEPGVWGQELWAAVSEHMGKCVCREGLQRTLFLVSLLENVWGQDPHRSPSPMQTGRLKSRVTAAAAARRAMPSPLQRPVCCRGQSRVPSGAEPRATPRPPFTGQQEEGYKGRLCSQAVSQPGAWGLRAQNSGGRHLPYRAWASGHIQ